jgi:hypothetical protein
MIFTKCIIFNSTSITKVVKIMIKMMAECVGVIEAQGFEGIYTKTIIIQTLMILRSRAEMWVL